MSAGCWRKRQSLWHGLCRFATKNKTQPNDASAVRYISTLRVSKRTAAGYASTLGGLLCLRGQKRPQLQTLSEMLRKAGAKDSYRHAPPAKRKQLIAFAARMEPAAVREMDSRRAAGAAAILLAWLLGSRLGEASRLAPPRRTWRGGGLTIDWAAETKRGASQLFGPGRFARVSTRSPMRHALRRLLRRADADKGLRWGRPVARQADRWIRTVPELQTLTGHSFRRGALGHLILKGVKLSRVSRFARHKDRRTTRRYLLGGLTGKRLWRMAQAMRCPKASAPKSKIYRLL